MLNAGHPMYVWWGEPLVCLYNDAYRKSIGPERHPGSLGQPAREVWAEIWDIIGPQIDQVMTGRGATWHENQLVPITRNGVLENVYWTYSYGPIDDETAPNGIGGVLVVCSETTAQVVGARRLAKSEDRLRRLNADLERQVAERAGERNKTWQVTSDLLGVLGFDGYFDSSNPAWQATLGYTPEEIGGTIFFDFLHADDLDRSRAAFDSAVAGQTLSRFENRYRHKDGSYRWLSWVAIPDGGKIYCSARDITAERAAEAELANTREELRQSHKMEAVGQLTGGLAHDFNNLLTGIGGSLEMMQMRIAQGDLASVDRYVTAAQGATKRAAALTHRLLSFSRKQTLDARLTDLDALVAGMEQLIRQTVGPAVRVDMVGSGSLWLTRIDIEPARECSAQSVHKRTRRHAQGRPADDRNRQHLVRRRRRHSARSCTGRLCVAMRQRHRHRDDAGHRRQGVRAVLHDQGRGRRNRPWPFHGLRVRSPVPRASSYRHEGRQGHEHLPLPAAPRRGNRSRARLSRPDERWGR